MYLTLSGREILARVSTNTCRLKQKTLSLGGRGEGILFSGTTQCI